jgi:hypothetical protein
MTQAMAVFTPKGALGLDAFKAWQTIDPSTIPLLQFVYGDAYAAGYMTVTFAAPKTGKSLLAMAEAIDAATGRGFLTGKPSAPQRVLYFNAEDDQNVLDGRVITLLKAQGAEQSEIAGRLTVVSGVPEANQLVLIQGERNEINEAAFVALASVFRRDQITLAIFDPLQDLSHSPETNEAFRALGGRIRRLASETEVAVGMIHHTRKPTAGVQATLDDGRGGSALRGVARFNRLLVPMTEAEGAQSGVDDFRRFFRIAEVESNLAPPSSDRNRWFEKIGVEIGNGGYAPAIKPWVWPEAFAGVTVNDVCRVRAAIATSDPAPRESAQAKGWAGHVVAEVLGLDLSRKSDKARVTAMLKKWIETGVLAVEVLPHGDKGKSAPFVVAGPNNPGAVE